LTVTCSVCVPETKQVTVNVTTYQQVQRQRQVNYVECVPVKKQGVQTVTEYQTVTQPVTETYVEMTQRVIEREVPVTTFAAYSGGCDSGCGGCGHHCGTFDHGCGGYDCGCSSSCGGKHKGGCGGKRGCR